jgi:GNAT superfamily N-acetyltransferase
MELRPEVVYTNAQENFEQEGTGQHHFSVFVDGKKVGAAEINYYSKPLPLYQLTDLYVEYEYQGKGYATELLDQFESFLVKRKKPGTLVNAIIDDDKHDLYTKRGWIEVPDGHGLMVFNWPKEVSLEILNGYPQMYTDHLERGNYYYKV